MQQSASLGHGESRLAELSRGREGQHTTALPYHHGSTRQSRVSVGSRKQKAWLALSSVCFTPQPNGARGSSSKRWGRWLHAYIEQFRFSSVVAQDLLDFFLGFFPELKESCVAQREGLEFERWLNECGPPLCEPDLSAGGMLTGPVQRLCELWGMESPDRQAIANFDLSTWSTFQTVLFLDRLLDRSPLPQEVMSLLSSCYSVLLDSMNAEVQIRWLQVVVRNSFYPELHRVRSFLQKHTSRMYTVPLYEDLCGGVLKCFAVEVFYQTQDRLHPNLRKALQQILFQNSAASASSTPALVGPPQSTPSPPPDAPTNGTIALLDVNVSA